MKRKDDGPQQRKSPRSWGQDFIFLPRPAASATICTPPVAGGPAATRAHAADRARLLALGLVAHVGGHLHEDTLDVHRRRVGDPTLAADRVVPGVQVDIVGTEVASAGEAGEGRAGGRHVGHDLHEDTLDVLGRWVGDPVTTTKRARSP